LLFSQSVLRAEHFSNAGQMNPAARRAVTAHWANHRDGIRRQLVQAVYQLIRGL